MSRAMDCRWEFSRSRLETLAGLAEDRLSSIVDDRQLCVYATGSYGRLEAWQDSDADLFVLYGGAEPFPKLDEIKIFGHLIEIVEEADFGPFDNDGRFLEIHDLGRMRKELGSPNDDGVNAFTARMLLLLESRPVQNPEMYRQLLERIIGFYFEKQEDHPEDFTPLFLLNDILRFWRTLTLNYESYRFDWHEKAKDRNSDVTGDEASARSALKNHKLKFSRLTTCFSMVARLAMSDVKDQAEVLRLCQLTPFERLDEVCDIAPTQVKCVEDLKRRYDEFLEFTQRDKDHEVLPELHDSGRRRALRESATEFGDRLYGLIDEVADPKRRRYLVI